VLREVAAQLEHFFAEDDDAGVVSSGPADLAGGPQFVEELPVFIAHVYTRNWRTKIMPRRASRASPMTGETRTPAQGVCPGGRKMIGAGLGDGKRRSGRSLVAPAGERFIGA
jgi:hypothetical protein